MAKRYSGSLKINVVYDDKDHYRTTVSRDGELLWRGIVRPAPRGFGKGVAYDSPEAYDAIAASALAFAEDEVGGVSADADFNEQGTGYLIRRSSPSGVARQARRAARHATKKGPFEASPQSRASPKPGKKGALRTSRREENPFKGPPLSVRKVSGRWQPVTKGGHIVRGNIYNADGTGYSTRQGAVEAAEMLRILGA